MLSVIIATYNRCASLGNVLNGLLTQEGLSSDTDYEIIVVDNNSTDGTKRLVEFFMDKAGDRLRYFFDPARGKAHALNLGIRESRGEILIFTDDDVIVDNKWIFHVNEFFKKFSVDAMGGRVLPVYPRSTPSWVKDQSDLLQGLVVRHDYGEDIKCYDDFMMPFVGSNMALKRRLYVGEDLFKNEVGLGTGRRGEDTELFRQLRAAHKKILYCGKVLVWHPVDRKKMTLRYIAQWHVSHGRYFTIREITQKGEGFLCHGKMFCYLGIDSIRRILGLMFGAFHQRVFLKHWNCFFTNVGMVVEYGVHFGRIVLKCLLCKKKRWGNVVHHLFRTSAG